MDAPRSLLDAVVDRVIEHEIARRVGRPLDARPRIVRPETAPPMTILAADAVPPEVLARRARFLRAVGWLDAAVAECIIGESPTLPDVATIEDQLAVLTIAERVRARSPEEEALAASYGVASAGAPLAQVDREPWDELFDRIADEAAPGWRDRWQPAAGSWPRLEALTLTADRRFGHRRVRSLWPTLAGVVNRMARLKRRWLR